MRRFLVLAVLLAACAEPPEAPSLALRIALVGPLAPLEPRGGHTATAAAQDLVFDMVLRPDAEGALRSRVLRSWSREPDGALRLLPDPAARFSDGSPLRAEDLAASLRAQGFTVRVEDDAVLAKKGEGGTSAELELLFTAVYRETGAGAIGTGPFALVEGDASRLLLRRVVAAPGRIGEVELAAFATPRDAFARVIRGEANGIVSLDERQLELLDGIPALRAIRAQAPHALTVLMNPRTLRAADRRELARVGMREVARAAYGARCEAEAPPGSAAAPALSRPAAVLTGSIDPGLERAGLALRRALGGAAGELVRADPSVFAEAQLRGRFDVALTPVLVWPPAILWLYWGTGAPWNGLGYSNPEFDAAVAAGDARAAARALEADPVLVQLCRRERIAAFDSRITNATLGNWGLLDTLPDWEVAR